MAGGENRNEPLIILDKNKNYDIDFFKKINEKRLDLISNIVYRIVSDKLGL